MSFSSVKPGFDGLHFDAVKDRVKWYRAHRRAYPILDGNDEWPYVWMHTSSMLSDFEVLLERSEEELRASIEVFPEPERRDDGPACLPVHALFFLALAVKTSPQSAQLWQLVKETFDAHPYVHQ
jgi:hypothetical protein